MRLRVLAGAFGLSLLPALALSFDAPLSGARPAAASVSILMSLDELVALSKGAVVATAGEHHSVWEHVAGARRIVTYTRLQVEKAAFGAGIRPGSEIWVRTLGGKVGSIGQYVSGEAQIAAGSRSLVFLAEDDGTFVVAGLSQGHFPVVAQAAGAPRTLRPSPDAGVLLPRRGPVISAREALVGVEVEAALAAIRRKRQAQDAKK